MPGGGPDVCPVCKGPRRVGYTLCFSCSRVLTQVARPCHRVAPVSLYALGGTLHRALRTYKDGRSAGVREHYARVVVTLLAGFLATHARCLGGGGSGRLPWDLVTTVPSTSGAVPHPLEEAIRLVPWLSAQHTRLLVRTAVPLGHLWADEGGFRVGNKVDGQRILLLDDTWTSGARAQSAASSLARAGATVVALVPVGRVVDPAWSPRIASWWQARAGLAYEPGTCCLGLRAARPATHCGAGHRGAG